MSLIRKAGKAAVLPLGVAGHTRAGDLVILLYHRVGSGRSEIELGSEAFKRQLATLAASGRVVSLDQAVAEGAGGIALTFDDGYRDFYEVVLPLLEQHRVPATLYLATGLVEGESSRAEAVAPRLTWQQLGEMASSDFLTVGAHTHNHADLSRGDLDVARYEMKKSKEMIEDQLGTACRHFAYPWSVGSTSADLVARQLFDSAAVDVWRTNRKGRMDPHALGRVPVLRSDGHLFFRAKMSGLLDGEALLYRSMRRGPWRRRSVERNGNST